MTTILHIDSSILSTYSVSRKLTQDIVERQRVLHPGAKVIRRDLAEDTLMALSGAHLGARQGAAPTSDALAADIAAGTAYVDDLFAADIIVIGAPMYNFSIPAQLKGWIDRVCIAGTTFKYTEKGPEGLVTGKKVFVASSRSGVYSGNSPLASLDHQESYLRVALGFIGMHDVTVIRAEGLAMGDEAKAAALAAAQAQIDALAA
jgi:FMN-dependent NADH-azoreductase